MSVPLTMMGPLFAFGSLPRADVQDWSRSTSSSQKAEKARMARRLNAQDSISVLAAQRKAAVMAAKITHRNAIVATKMPALWSDLQLKATTRISDHLKKLRCRDLMELAARDMCLTMDSPFELGICDLCQEEMARPKGLPCGHEFCERCVIAEIEVAGEKVARCPTCEKEVQEWYLELKAKVCRKEVGEFHNKVRKALKEAEREVGVKRKWWDRGPRMEEVGVVVEEFLDSM